VEIILLDYKERVELMVDKEKLQRKREETKKEILEKLKTCDRFAVVRPFGFGKTYTILELCKTLEGRKIIIEPSLEILKNIKNNINEDTDCITYNTLLHKDFNSEKLLQYNYIFLDEIHRTLAPKWGKVLRDVLEKFKGKVVGFTATPIRGDGRKPVDEIFKGEQITELSLVEAIVEEFLPNPTYVTGIYELNQITLKNKQLKVQLKNYDLQNSLNTMFNKYLDLTKTLKIMVFSSTVEDIKKTKKYIEEWFEKKVNHYVYHSYQLAEENEEQLNKFKNAQEGINVIHSVNQLSEGFHFENLDALIFLRKTNSDVVYLQQLGRGLSDNLQNIVVFDLMNNFLRKTNGFHKLIKEYSKKYNLKIEDIKTINKEPLKIFFEQQDLVDIFMKTQQKYQELLLNDYQKNFILKNYKNMSLKKMSQEIKKSINTISKFLQKNNLPYNEGNGHFSTKERDFILSNYNKFSLEKIEEITGRNIRSIRKFLKKNNIYINDRLTNSQKQYIEENYENKKIIDIANELNRDRHTISSYIKKIKEIKDVR